MQSLFFPLVYASRFVAFLDQVGDSLNLTSDAGNWSSGSVIGGNHSSKSATDSLNASWADEGCRLNGSGPFGVDLELDSYELLRLLSLLALTFLVVSGNFLVVLAVLTTKKLRSVNSLFITSLAIADLLVGAVVLPFSTANEVFHKIWVFGEVWCQVWLAVDVWLCTASIYNLVAISLDRLAAITRPLQYRCLITMRRGRVAVVVVWAISFIISSPPIFLTWPKVFGYMGWLPPRPRPREGAGPRCECSPLGNTPPYILYSAIGSFFLPMTMIVLIYAKIYNTARSATKASYLGQLSIRRKAGRGKGEAGAGDVPLMRVHSRVNRDRNCVLMSDTQSHSIRSLTRSPYLERESSTDKEGGSPLPPPSKKTTLPSLPLTPDARDDRFLRVQGGHLALTKKTSAPLLRSSPSQSNNLSSMNFPVSTGLESPLPPPSPAPGQLLSRSPSTRRHSKTSDRVFFNGDIPTLLPAAPSSSGRFSKLFQRRKNPRRNAQSRLTFELKAAKTVAVVTGCFIFCWLGFSIVYVMQAFPSCAESKECVPETVFSVVFWLGYINSALNPLIYALFNRKFREAFKLLLTCQCKKKKEYSVVNRIVLI